MCVEISEINHKLKRSIDLEMETEEGRTVETTKKNPKYYYSYARRKHPTRLAIGHLIINGEMVGEAKENADAILRHCHSAAIGCRWRHLDVSRPGETM